MWPEQKNVTFESGARAALKSDEPSCNKRYRFRDLAKQNAAWVRPCSQAQHVTFAVYLRTKMWEPLT